MRFRDLAGQYGLLKADIDAAVLGVLESGTYIGGEPVSTLEEQLAEYVGVRHCIACGNGTDALQLALMAWGIGEGDAVFVPDFTFFSSGEVVSAVGATPAFVDVDERTFNLDAAKLEQAVESIEAEGVLRARAVVAVDLFGLPADYAAISSVCKRHGLLLLEDGAQGFGGSIDGKRSCSFGDISTTSFFPAKPLGCYGDGGAVFTDDDEWAELVRSYAVHGKGSMKYDNVRIGMNSRLDAIQAAILQVKLRAFVEHELAAVDKMARRYSATLEEGGAEGRGIVLPLVPGGFQSAWAQYTVQLPSSSRRAAIQEALQQEGIPSMVYYPKPMHEQAAFAAGCIAFGAPASTSLCQRVLSLPIGPCMKASDVDRVVDVLLSA